MNVAGIGCRPLDPVVYAVRECVRQARVCMAPGVDQRGRPPGPLEQLEVSLHPRMAGILGQVVEVAGQDRRHRLVPGVEGAVRGIARAVEPGVREGLGVARAHRLDLRGALQGRVVLQVGGHHPQRPEGRLQAGLEQQSGHAVVVRIGRPGQLHAQHLPHRQAAQDHVAENAPAAVGRGRIDRRAGHCGVAGQQLGQQGELVLAAAACERREVRRDLLQAQHVEIGERPRVFDDARRIDAAVHAAAPLDVPGDQLHRMRSFSVCPPA